LKGGLKIMKFNFKKIASVIATTAMLGSTIAFAAAAYPAPFVNNGVGDAAIVVGSGSGVASTDMVAATDLGASLDANITSSSSASLSGTGDQASVGTSARQIYYNDGINAARSSLSSSELPTVLADGKFLSLTGTEYDYTQNLILGGTQATYGTDNGNLNDPALYLNVGTTPGNFYNYSLTFNKNLNITDGTNVQGQKLNVLGVDYIIGAQSDASLATPVLYLYGAGQDITVAGGETKTVTIAGKEHVIELVTTGTNNDAKITVDGVSKTVSKGNSYSYAGDLNVYVKDVTNPQYAGDVREVDLIIGANTILLQNGTTVKTGADQTSVPGTLVTLSTSGNLLSGVKVAESLQKSQADAIAIGSSFTDPVFGGLKVQLVSVNPAIADSSRDQVKVSTDNNQFGYVTFTSARAGDKGEQQLTFAYDNNTASTGVQPLLAHQTTTSGKGLIHVLEGQSALINDWIVVNQGDAGTILNVDDISFDTATSGTATFSDAITGEARK